MNALVSRTGERLSHARVGDGCRLAYRFDGPEDAPVLVLAHSLGADVGLWTPVLPALTTRFRVLRYDSRGHGASDVPGGAYSIDRLGRDVEELLDRLHLDEVSFCGVSMGGMVGQWLGVRAPERIERLVLASTSPYMGPPERWQDRIDTVERNGVAALVEGTLERWFTPAFGQRAPRVIEETRAMLLATPPVGYGGCCAAIRDMDLRPTAKAIAPPTLLIAGADDPATPPSVAEALAARIADARVVTLEASHLANVEQADAFARAVLEFAA